MQNYCCLALGSNLKTPKRQLRKALEAIQKLPKTTLLRVANFYPNQAVGRKAQPPFLNTVVLIQTTLKPLDLLSKCLGIEQKQGRARKLIWGSRTLDIDILAFGKLKMQSSKLTIPHPRMFERDFVLIPLFELFSYCSFGNADSKLIKLRERELIHFSSEVNRVMAQLQMTSNKLGTYLNEV